VGKFLQISEQCTSAKNYMHQSYEGRQSTGMLR